MIQSLDIKTAAGSCDAWIARPEGAGPWPGIVFCMDAVGPREVLKQMAERLAMAGYVVLLPNIFYRLKRAPLVSGIKFPVAADDIPKLLAQIMPLVESFDSREALSDMRVFIDFLENKPYVRKGKMGIFGYCMGGALAIRTAAEYKDKFGAVASFHSGGLVSDDADSPHHLLSKLTASMYVGHADQDPHMTGDQIAVFNKAAAMMTAPHKIELYSGAAHHFTMSDLPAYNHAAAEKHWSRLLQLFNESLLIQA